MQLKKLALPLILSLCTAACFAQGTTKPEPIGGNQDKHGCYTSAGYSWSIIKNTCVRWWEVGTRLDSVGKSSTVTYILFSDDKKKVEVFMPHHAETFILLSTGPNVYKFKNYTLHTEKGYLLSNNGQAIYTGVAK